jgi:hypothetical protein
MPDGAETGPQAPILMSRAVVFRAGVDIDPPGLRLESKKSRQISSSSITQSVCQRRTDAALTRLLFPA